MITFEESILMTIILQNTGQESSLEQTPPHPRRNTSTLLTVCSTVMGRFVFQICHDAPSTGHLGIHRTLVLISTQFYWPKMRPDIHSYVTKCHQCQVNKAERLKAAGLLHPLDIPNNKWESISMDFIVSLPRTQKGHDAIWVVVDYLD